VQVLRIAHDGEPPADLSDLTFLHFLRVLADHPAYCQKRCASSATSPGLQSLVEWSDNRTVDEVLAAQGIDHGATCHLIRRDSVAETVELWATERSLAQQVAADLLPAA
jgi:hypothetical protein